MLCQLIGSFNFRRSKIVCDHCYNLVLSYVVPVGYWYTKTSTFCLAWSLNCLGLLDSILSVWITVRYKRFVIISDKVGHVVAYRGYILCSSLTFLHPNIKSQAFFYYSWDMYRVYLCICFDAPFSFPVGSNHRCVMTVWYKVSTIHIEISLI